MTVESMSLRTNFEVLNPSSFPVLFPECIWNVISHVLLHLLHVFCTMMGSSPLELYAKINPFLSLAAFGYDALLQ